MWIENVTPSKSTVDAALCGVVPFGGRVEVPDADGALLVASGHFAAVADDDKEGEK